MWAFIVGSRARLVFLVCAVAAGYFVYTYVNGAVETERIAAERAEASRQLIALNETRNDLVAVKQYAGSDAYVEQEARRRLGFVRYGEIPIVVTSPPLEGDSRPSGNWWQRLFPR